MKRIILFAALCGVACGEKKDEAGGGAAKSGGAATGGVQAVNAAIPAALADKLVFEPGKGEDGEADILVPKGWKAGFMPGSFEPPDESDLGFMTDYTVKSNCDGMCQPKDWKGTAEKEEFAEFRREGFKIEKEEDIPGGHMLVASKDDKTWIAFAWWKDGVNKYWACRATLHGKIAAAAPAFEAACRETKINRWH